jgi:hypothetical protein
MSREEICDRLVEKGKVMKGSFPQAKILYLSA